MKLNDIIINTINIGYKYIIKPIAFLFDPESTHDTMIHLARFISSHRALLIILKKIFTLKDSKLQQTINDITFENPVGLSEGFDKNADVLPVIDALGFGFAQVGSVTYHEYAGNEGLRLQRLIKSKSIWVNYGLKSDGVRNVVKKLSKYNIAIPYSISVAKTNSADTCDTTAGIEDYKKCLDVVLENDVANFYTINISCPNTFGGEPFTDPTRLKLLLDKLFIYNNVEKPVFVKMAVDLECEQLGELLEVCSKFDKIKGVIISNLTKKREGELVKDDLINKDIGGLSGKPTFDKSNELIRYTYKNYRNRFTIIGVGGIFSGHDAYTKIKCGASLVQLITGLIFEGPQLIYQIKKDLLGYIDSDGYKTIAEAVGAEC